ncbi:unnamed protein product [Arctia plantaginis]|uniref:Uncharacterized protein n=1 Tax=Arctia plantaginis TaxID=874455 RepID=A0A8S1BGG7_ARCPL|nr:unnamed protein product [Arctia plantaginis]
MDGRRQLSISRSGRLRQANKKRHSLTLELYGDTIDIDQIKKHTHVEYHVHGPASNTAPTTFDGNDNRLDDDSSIEDMKTENVIRTEHTFEVNLEKKLNALALESGNKTPEEEIDNAFDVIDKS